MRDERFKQREELPSRVQLILHLEQWIRSNAWLGNNNRCVANTATMAGTPRSRANWIWFSWTSFGATERVVTLRCIKKAPKLATPSSRDAWSPLSPPRTSPTGDSARRGSCSCCCFSYSCCCFPLSSLPLLWWSLFLGMTWSCRRGASLRGRFRWRGRMRSLMSGERRNNPFKVLGVWRELEKSITELLCFY